MALETITEINLDVNQPGLEVVHAKQYDTVRKVRAHLFYNGVKWPVPSSDFVAVVSYKKADRIGGFYDQTEDGEIAVAVDGNDRSIVTILLDRNTVTVEGNCNVEITFYDSIQSGRLSTFSFILQVEAASLTELDLASNPYFNILSDDIRAVLEAEEQMVGITATASSVPEGTQPTITVTGGISTGHPYNFAFGIPKGDKGDEATPKHVEYSYAVSESATTIPSSGWSTNPAPVHGKYLWSRAIYTWDNDETSAFYGVSYIAMDGGGSTASEIIMTDRRTVQEAFDGLSEDVENQEIYVELNYNGAETVYYVDDITSDYLISYATLENPSAQTSDWIVTTGSGTITISGSASESTTVKLLMSKASTRSIRSNEVSDSGSVIPSGTSRGKVISILGDSISTYAGYIPETNVAYYDSTKLSSVNDTWWMKVINALGATLGVDEAWSGSRVTVTQSGFPESKAGCSDSRTGNLGDPDIIIIWMGINDFNNEVTLGTYDGTGAFPTDTTKFKDAYAIMLHKIMTNYPKAEVYCCTLPPCERNGATGYPPEINDSGILLDTWNDAIRKLSAMFGAQLLDLARAGITYENLRYYVCDWGDAGEEKGLHPNADGFSRVANFIIKNIDPACRVRYTFNTTT